MGMVGKFVQLVVQLVGIRYILGNLIFSFQQSIRMGMVGKFALLVAQLE
jgi:hypothetical protein